MADSSNNDTPSRQLSPIRLGLNLYKLDLARKLRARKTLILFAIQLLPVAVALLALIWVDLDGLQVFEETVAGVYLPFLIPLAALFFGGPTIVDEVEGRTITYLTLRPVPRSILFAAKLAASVLLTVATSTISVIAFYLVCTLGGGGLTEGLDLLGWAAFAVVVGAKTYTTIFALLGVVFASTLLPGIVYYVVFELIIGAVPIVEMLSVKFHLYTLGGFDRTGADDGGARETLEQFLLDQPLEFDWWVGFVACVLITAAATLIAATVFRSREFHV